MLSYRLLSYWCLLINKSNNMSLSDFDWHLILENKHAWIIHVFIRLEINRLPITQIWQKQVYPVLSSSMILSNNLPYEYLSLPDSYTTTENGGKIRKSKDFIAQNAFTQFSQNGKNASYRSLSDDIRDAELFGRLKARRAGCWKKAFCTMGLTKKFKAQLESSSKGW